jgi:hypothetical protein
VLFRLAYLAVTNVFALLRLLPVSDRDKDTEILALRHQITVLQRQLGTTRLRFSPADRALLAALLHRLPRYALDRYRLLVRPDTVLRWHRNLLALWVPKIPSAPLTCTVREQGSKAGSARLRVDPSNLNVFRNSAAPS